LLKLVAEPIFMTIIMNIGKYDDHHLSVNRPGGEFSNEGQS
jgi:hypothetical protein